MPLRLSIILFVAIMGGLLVALQSFGPAIGLTRDGGLWVWAVAGVVLIALLFGPGLARHTGGRRAWLLGAFLLAAGVGVYLYVTEVMLPAAIERANAPVVPRR